jgi:hypothetical protein
MSLSLSAKTCLSSYSDKQAQKNSGRQGLSERSEREKSLYLSQRRQDAKNSGRGEREKDIWNSRGMAFLGDLCGLSECNERAREKLVSHRDAENSEKQEK